MVKKTQMMACDYRPANGIWYQNMATDQEEDYKRHNV